jgi:hypothetical protein
MVLKIIFCTTLRVSGHSSVVLSMGWLSRESQVRVDFAL